MYQSLWFFRPVSIFIFSLLALASSFFLYIYWYLRVHDGLSHFVEKFKINPDPFMETHTWVIILTLSVLLSIIVIGLVIIFLFYNKSINLYRQQNNFVNNFTHELKTPLTSLRLFLDTFKTHQLERSDQLKYIGYMEKDTHRLSLIVERILNTARIESQTYKTNFETLNIFSVATDFFEKNKTLFPSASFTVINKSGHKSFMYSLDKVLIDMMLSNIVTNAIKYNNNDIADIKITFIKYEKYFEISISDNGIGIDKKELKNIFKKFYQVGRSLDMSAQGSGIGLFLVQTIAQIHRIKVLAVCQGIGFGSTFKIIFKKKWESK